MVTLFVSLFTIQQRHKYYFPCCIFLYMCVFFLMRIYPSALFFLVRFFPSALFSYALIYICAFFRCAFFLCAFFQCAFFWSPYEPYLFHGSFLVFRWSCHPPPAPGSFIFFVGFGVLCNEDIALQLVPLSLFVFFFFRSVSLTLAPQYCTVSTFSITLLLPSLFVGWQLFFYLGISMFLSSIIYLILY